MSSSHQLPRRILVTDCGSTTTKALLFEQRADGAWYTRSRGEAPTTVEAPIADVTVGALNAFREIEELSGVQLIRSGSSESATSFADLFLPRDKARPDVGLDLYLSTSSAGGGLQMLVAGLAREYSANSAARAALGAGAIVMDVICAEDPRTSIEWIDRLRHLKPDIVLLTGGTDGGAIAFPIEVAEMLLQARPRPRFGQTIRVPVIYAGNAAISQEITELLSPIADVSVTANVRASLDEEQIAQARDAVHELFLSHVMSHAPGYGKLMGWASQPIMPTPAAAGDMVRSYALAKKVSILCADIGGATTDVFSVFPDAEGEPVFNRTVSANLGMSYSIGNVLKEAGIARIERWLESSVRAASTSQELDHRIRNKMIRPTSIPQTLEDLKVEQAVCREALRLSLVHHRQLAVSATKRQRRTFADIFGSKERDEQQLVNLAALDMVVGSGGVLSHAPDRVDAAMMMIDGFGLCGITELFVDSVFMMPHLGVLAGVEPQAAAALFEQECLVAIGCHLRPVRVAKGVSHGQPLAEVRFNGTSVGEICFGSLVMIGEKLANQRGDIEVIPRGRQADFGAGFGQARARRRVQLGQVGLFLDGRALSFHGVEAIPR